jgi:hypothetical protein
LTIVVFEPRRLKKNAQTAAHTVTATESSAVSKSFDRILGRRPIAFASGTRFVTIQTTAFGREVIPWTGL